MPRKYVPKKIKTYTAEDLAKAIEKVKNGELTKYSAAQQYGIPMTTLYEHVNECSQTRKPNAGRPTAIPLEAEEKIAETIKTMEKWGFGLSRSEIMELVGDYVRINNIKTPFKNNAPGPDWFINFRKRHRLSIKKAQPVEYVRRKMTDPFVVGEYFDLLEKTLEDLNLSESPQSIWNLDETSLCLDPSRTKVVGEVNKPCARTTHGSGKENITVLAGASASGKKLPPLIVYKGKFVWDQWMAELDSNNYDFELSYAASKKGWMETDIFYKYMEKILIPCLGDDRPALIIYDGHSTHVDVRVVKLAIENDITILKLPPHTSHLLQPLDLTVFKSFKMTWDAKLVEWQRKNVGTKIPKNVFALMLADTWQQTDPEIIRNGFKKAGIYPFNSQVIPVHKYDLDAYKRYQKKKIEAKIAHTQLPHENPKSLKEICIDWFNNQLLRNNVTIEKAETENTDITLFSQLSRSDKQTTSFVAKDSTQMPTCLQNVKPIQSQLQQPKIKIISNIIIRPASTQPVQTQTLPQLPCTFEELLLRKLQQDRKTSTLTKKKRVTKGAEVITAAMGKKILEEAEQTKKANVTTKSSNNDRKTTKVNKKNNSTNKKCTELKKEEQPGPSGIKRRNKRKRQPSLDSVTSVSDIMSEYNDSDIIDGIDLNDLIETCSEDDLEKLEKSPKFQRTPKDIKLCAKRIKKVDYVTEEEILTNKDPNCIKGKGIGKKSKGKENQVVKKDKECKAKGYDQRDTKGDGDLATTEGNKSTKEKHKDDKLLLRLDNKDKANGTERELHDVKENYQINDCVLVRYLIRKKWKYYIGYIEDIKNDIYTINFLKTTRPRHQLTFITTKKKDTDKVPVSIIVKKIGIQRNKLNEKEYNLCNEEDTIYFD